MVLTHPLLLLLLGMLGMLGMLEGLGLLSQTV